ncbi:MAG: hypothetical protein NZ516_04440, partial [Raineya sp.]|nr:hypothetical protein [Raineya sp.]
LTIFGNMVLNKDFREFIELLNVNKVRYLVVGGYAVAFHGYPRYTKDLDVWIWLNPENAQKVLQSLQDFGFGNVGLSVEDFLAEDSFIQLGYPPNRIDITTTCDGIKFEECYEQKIIANFQGLEVPFIDLENLKKNKKATARPQDLADLDNLEAK